MKQEDDCFFVRNLAWQMTNVTINWKQHHNVIKQEVVQSFTSEIVFWW